MRKIITISDVVKWGLCIGCGACYYKCDKDAVLLFNIETIGIRPKFKHDICKNCNDCLSICPGYYLYAEYNCKSHLEKFKTDILIGPTIEIWEGYATDEKLRYRASSGGVLSALALYCLEKENMEFVLHTGMNQSRPWLNTTVQSKNISHLLSRTGSRYAPSSPCDSLYLIEQSNKPCVFIGKPCDTAAVTMLRKQNPKLNSNLGLVLTFFCAGPPCTHGTLKLLNKLNINQKKVDEIRYRGDGWPGKFKVIYNNKREEKSLKYKESWSLLSKHHRSFRCHICPDGLGELSDISCGDAWHRYSDDGNIGQSLILVRSQRGKEILQRAVNSGYIVLINSGPSEVISAQALVKRRSEVFGRILAMRLLLIPTPHFVGFSLFKAWFYKTSFLFKIKIILGTTKRLLKRGLWHRNPVFIKNRNNLDLK